MGTMTNGFTRLTEQFLVHIGVERGLATATVTAYESDIAKYIDWLETRGIHEPDAITKQDVEDYVAALARRGVRPLQSPKTGLDPRIPPFRARSARGDGGCFGRSQGAQRRQHPARRTHRGRGNPSARRGGSRRLNRSGGITGQGPARIHVRHRLPRLGSHRCESGRHRPGQAHRATHGQGLQAAACAIGQLRMPGHHRIPQCGAWRVGTALQRQDSREARTVSQQTRQAHLAAIGMGNRQSNRESGPASPNHFIRTPCAIPLPRT